MCVCVCVSACAYVWYVCMWGEILSLVLQHAFKYINTYSFPPGRHPVADLSAQACSGYKKSTYDGLFLFSSFLLPLASPSISRMHCTRVSACLCAHTSTCNYLSVSHLLQPLFHTHVITTYINKHMHILRSKNSLHQVEGDDEGSPKEKGKGLVRLTELKHATCK